MTKFWKRHIACVLLAIMVLSCMPLSAFAAATQFTEVTVNPAPLSAKPEEKPWFNSNVKTPYGKPKIPIDSDGNVTLTKPDEYASVIQYDDNGIPVAEWVCIGGGNTIHDYARFKNDSVTFKPNLSGSRAIVSLFWERHDISGITITYDFNQDEISGYSVYPAQLFSWNPTSQEVVDGIIDNIAKVPVCYFAEGNNIQENRTAKAYAGGSIKVGMGLKTDATDPYVDFIARKVEGEKESFQKLTGWKVQGGDDKVFSQGDTFTPTADTTFVAQWAPVEDADLEDSGEEPKLQLAKTTPVSGVDYDAVIYQQIGERDEWTTGMITPKENETIRYRAEVQMDPLVASTHLLGGRTVSESNFAQFDITVQMDSGLELVDDDDGNVSIEFKCSFLEPGKTMKVNGTPITIKSAESPDTTDSKAKSTIYTITASKTAIDEVSKGSDDKVTLTLPVQWKANASTSNLGDKMYMIASARVKDSGKISQYHTTGKVTGKIDLSKAKVTPHQVIRYILGYQWKDYIIDEAHPDGLYAQTALGTLRAAKHLDWSLQHVELTANTATVQPAHVHSYTESVEPPTCTEAGSKTYTCEKCGNTYTEEISATGHTEENIPDLAATCTSAGHTGGKRCSVCETILVESTPTDPLGHSYTSAVTRPSSCTSEGVRTYTCSRCNETYTVAISATGHTSVNVAEVPATCTTTGRTAGTSCSVCGAVITGQEVIPTIPHTSVTDARVEPTCTAAGKTEGSHCSVCNTVLTAQEDIPALDHDYSVEWTHDDTNHWHKCSRCDATQDTAAHTWDSGVVTTIATTSREGVRTFTCTVCGATRTESIPRREVNAPTGPSGGGSRPNGGNTPSNPDVEINDPEVPLAQLPLFFVDVPETEWFRDPVAYVFNKGLMTGVTDTYFQPYGDVTRGMMATLLYRMAGEPGAGSSNFADVASDMYYYTPVAWGSAVGVVKGYTDTEFRPNNAITRQDLAVMLYRYAQLKGYDTSRRADLSGYADQMAIYGYAREAMEWAVAEGLMNGVGDNRLAPNGTASRSQAAMLLMRFCENIAK